MIKTPLPLREVYRLLEPGPVVLVTSAWGGRANVMTLSWHMMVDFEPPIVGCVISKRDYTFRILKETKECVINIPSVELARQVVGCGNTSGRKVDKFNKFHLTAIPATRVGAPLIFECHANLECKVIDTSMTDRYNLFLLEVIQAWIDRSRKRNRTLHHCGRGVFMVAGRMITLPSKMK